MDGESNEVSVAEAGYGRKRERMLTVYKQHDYIGLGLLLNGASSSEHK